MMTGDDIQNHRREIEGIDASAPSLEGKRLLALWVIAEQLYEIRAIFASFQEALQAGFGEHNGFLRVQEQPKEGFHPTQR